MAVLVIYQDEVANEECAKMQQHFERVYDLKLQS